jgi:hypothetical protein
MMHYPQPSGISFTGQQGRDFSRWLTVAQWLGIFLLTPVAVCLFFIQFPHAPISPVLFFLFCFLTLGWVCLFQGIWWLAFGCLLLIKPSAVRSLAQKTASNWRWPVTSSRQLALSFFWSSLCAFAGDGLISLAFMLLPPFFFVLVWLSALILLALGGLIVINRNRKLFSRGTP